MQFETRNITKWMGTLPEDRLAALRAHCEDGKLSYTSCSCLIGSRTAAHALGRTGEYCMGSHVDEARRMPYGLAAEVEFYALGWTDELRRERLLPLIVAEQERRAQSTTSVLDAREAVPVA